MTAFPVKQVFSGRFLSVFVAAVCLSLVAACGTTGKVGPGQYRVVAGDTLTKIARQHGQSVNSLMKMNNLRNANNIKVGQVLRVGSGSASSGSLPDAGSSTVVP